MSAHSTLHRPRTVTLVLWGVIFLGVWNAGRALVLFKQRTIFMELHIRPSVWVQLFFAVGFCCLFWVCAWRLWQKRPYVQYMIPILITIYALYRLGIQLLFAATSTVSSLTLTGFTFAGIILFTYWALNRKAAQTYFQNCRKSGEDSG